MTASANGKLVASAITGANGTFAIEVPAAVASIMVGKRGFATVTRPVGDKRAPLPPVDIVLTRAATVSGRVIDAQGRPIVSVRVNVTPLETTADSQTTTTTTDDRGIFRIGGLSPATYSIVTDGRPEYRNTIVTTTLSPESVAILRQFKMVVAPSSEPVTNPCCRPRLTRSFRASRSAGYRARCGFDWQRGRRTGG